MFPLDYLDYDVSNLLGKYVQEAKETNKTKEKLSQVLGQLQYMADFNIHIQYLRKFKKFKKRYIPYHIGSHYQYLWDDKKLVEGTIEFLKQPVRTKYVHDCPTKKPIFMDTDCYPTKTNRKTGLNDGPQRGYHSYPPERIEINRLPSMCKKLQDLK